MKHFLIPVFLVILVSCSSIVEDEIQISGQIFNASELSVSLDQKAVHYKYAPQISTPLTLDSDGQFNLQMAVDSSQIASITINDYPYPVVLDPGTALELQIDMNRFPLNVIINGNNTEWNSNYQAYLADVIPVEIQIQQQLPAFRVNETNQVLPLFLQRIEIAQHHLNNTPLNTVIYRNVGEYLERALQRVRILKDINDEFSGIGMRESIVDFAHDHDFFSLQSLKAQRAGIRDFAHNYAMSFDVQDSLRSIYGDQLAEQDIKRLGYEQLNSYRMSIINQIPSREAKAYADMHIVAERLGEMPLDVAEPTLETYLNNYGDFTEYADFLRTFYREVNAVAPGQPSVPFTLPDENEQMVSMSDFDNKYVLIDFWASWCVPCLDEFPDMKRIYDNTPREQFEIISISIEADSLQWRRALSEFDNPWIQLYAGQEFQQETFNAYQGGGIPFYILVNPKGTIERYNDIRASFNLESVLDSLLTNHPPGNEN